MAEGARRRREVFASRREAFDTYSSKPPYDAVAPEALWAYVEHGFEDLPDGTVRLKCRRENEARVFEQGATHNAYAWLAEVRCPVGLAFGAEGQGPLAQANAAALAARLPMARLDAMTASPTSARSSSRPGWRRPPPPSSPRCPPRTRPGSEFTVQPRPGSP